ncbi:MAG: class I SAM-dependent methyltransferase [Clostridia bacterium]|nr:class I SAM-dependent methyltransferase [Clostridia bacterium]
MKQEELIKLWKEEEKIAHIKGWDFSHLDGRFETDQEIPWDYEKLVRKYLRPDMRLMDYDTGGGEVLLTFGHPYDKTSATEGYPPNVELCRKTLLPLGIDFRECNDASNLPFDDESVDIMTNRHGDFDPVEIRRILKPGGYFVSQQVGESNDRDLVELVLPDAPRPFEGQELNLASRKKAFEDAGFEILESGEVFTPIKFYDVGAFVWFARVIEWEFIDFSVDRCLDRLLKLQERIEKDGVIEGKTHRYMIVAQKK